MIRRVAAAWPVAVVCCAVALVSSAFLYGTPLDEEEFRFAVLSAWLRMRALAGGDFLYWSSDLGFGIPQPFIPNFTLHPFAPLLAAVPPVAWVRLVLFVHTIVGAIGMWLLCRRLELSHAVAAVCVVTYLLASPVQNYVLSDFWPSHHVMWTSVPWILLLVWRLLRGDAERSWRSGVGIGLVTGLAIANANPSYAAVYAVLGIAILMTAPREAGRQWIALAVAFAIAAAVVSPVAAHLIVERGLLPRDLGLSNVTNPLTLSQVVDSLVRPASELNDTRTLFVGAPFTLLALAGGVWCARAHTDLVVAAAAAALMLFTAWVPVAIISQRYQFRDPLTLCMILLAGCVVDRWWRRRGARPVAALVLLVQTTVITAAAWPWIERTWGPDGIRGTVFRGATADTPLVDRLIAAMPAPGRVLYSPRVDHAVAERALVQDGLGVNALAYRGATVVNGSFKSIATDTLWPNDRLFYGWIRGPQALVEANASLDVLGIRYVLAYRGDQVAPALREVWSDVTLRGAELVLFENSDAGPGAFLADPARLEDELPRYAACDHDRLLCRDIGRLAGIRDPEVTAIERSSNEIRVTWPPVPPPRMLIVTEMYRPSWTATSDSGPLEVRPVYGGFIGVPLRPGVTSVRLRYRPRGIIAATAVSHGTIVVALVALAVSAGHRRRRRATSKAQSA